MDVNDFIMDVFSQYEIDVLEKNPSEQNIIPKMTLIKSIIEPDEEIVEPLLVDFVYKQVSTFSLF